MYQTLFDIIQVVMGQEGVLNRNFTGSRGRALREAVTAYLFILPAIFLILLFGIFPVGFALYVSVHKWQLIQGEFRGLRNYVSAVDNLIYVVLFFMAIGAVLLSIRTLRRIYSEIQEEGYDNRLWLLALPGLFQAGAITSFFGWAYVQLPEFLAIANQLRLLERSRETYFYLLDQAFRAAPVVPAWNQFIIFSILALVTSAIAIYFWRSAENPVYQFRLAMAWLGLALGPVLLNIVFNAITAEYAAAIETGTDPGIWPQFIMISSGVILLILAWKLWQGAENAESNLVLVLRFLASLALMVGAVLLIIQIPTIVASGDPDLWTGLKVTVYFSLGTVPVQLTIALFLSVLLFQKLKGSELFRILYFIPYVTPAVASAAVFKQLFSNRSSAPANALLQGLGFEPQLWLREPDGVSGSYWSEPGL